MPLNLLLADAVKLSNCHCFQFLVCAILFLQCEVSLVELPRLKARFAARTGDDGVTRLYSLDYDGLFVSSEIDETVWTGTQ